MDWAQVCEKNLIYVVLTVSLSTGSDLVTRAFTDVIMPVNADEAIENYRQQLGVLPRHQRAGTVCFQMPRLTPVCVFNLITNEL